MPPTATDGIVQSVRPVCSACLSRSWALQKWLNRSRWHLCGLRWVPGATLSGKEVAHCKAQGLPTMRCAKTAEPIQIQYGILSQVGPGNHVLDGVHTVTTRRIWFNHPCAAEMQPYVRLLCPLAYFPVIILCNKLSWIPITIIAHIKLSCIAWYRNRSN